MKKQDLVIYSESTCEIIAIIAANGQIIAKNGYNCQPITDNCLAQDEITGQLKYLPKKDNIIYLQDYVNKYGRK